MQELLELFLMFALIVYLIRLLLVTVQTLWSIAPCIILGICVAKLAKHARCEDYGSERVKKARLGGIAALVLQLCLTAFNLFNIFMRSNRVFSVSIHLRRPDISDPLTFIPILISGAALAFTIMGLAYACRITNKEIRRGPRGLFIAATIILGLNFAPAVYMALQWFM